MSKIEQDVGPEAKLLFLRFVLKNEDRALKATVRELGHVFGVADNATSNATAELELAGYLVRKPVVDGRGRPAFEYQVSPADLGRLRDEAAAVTAAERVRLLIEHLVEIERPQVSAKQVGGELDVGKILGLGFGSRPEAEAASDEVGKGKGPQPPDRTGAGSKLSNANRLLLLVLLAHADDTGVVRGMGPADLAAVTGLTKGKVQAQIQKLVNLRYLRSVVRGVTGRRLFGVAPGAYFLNLQHPAYGKRRAEATIFMLSAASGIQLREAQQLVEVAKALPQKGGFKIRITPYGHYPNPPDIHHDDFMSRLASILDCSGSPGIADYLQHKIECYAAYLLSKQWRRLCSSESDDDLVLGAKVDSDLKKRIEVELVPAAVYRQEVPSLQVLRRYGSLVDLIYMVSVRLAESIKHSLGRIRVRVGDWPHARLNRMEFVLLPATEPAGATQYSVVAYPSRPSSKKGACYCLCPEYDRFYYPVPEGGRLYEEEYTRTERSRFGLITRQSKV